MAVFHHEATLRTVLIALLLASAASAGDEKRYWRPIDRIDGLPLARVLALRPAGPDRIRASTAEGDYLVGPYAATPVEPSAPAQVETVRPPDTPDDVSGIVSFRDWYWGVSQERGIVRCRTSPRLRPVEIPGANRVHALARAADGSLWCGTENGLARVRDTAIEVVPAIDGTRLGTVTAVAVDAQQRVWVGSGSSFLGVYRRDAGGWRKIEGIDGYVHRITRDPAGALWFAALNAEGQPSSEGRGAFYFSEGEIRPAPANVDLPSQRVYDVVARDAAGVLWFATLKGLAAYEGPDRVTHYTAESGLAGEKVWCLCAGSDGSLWIGYQREKGVTRFASGRLQHFDVEDGLCDGNVWAIAEGRREVFWFASESGVSRFDGVRWSCFRDEEGLGSAPVWPLLPADDVLWLGTLGAGLVRFRLDDDAAPRTRFDAARYESDGGAVAVSWRGADAWYDTPAAELCFRWRLDGGRWSAATKATRLELAPEPGRHRLEVQAIDRFGNAEDPPAAVEVVVGAASPGGGWLLLFGTALALCAVALLIVRRARRGS